MSDLNTSPGAVPCLLASMVHQYASLPRRDQDGGDGRLIAAHLRDIGRVAAYFGGFEAMTKLHDAAEAAVGNDNSVGYWLNQFWDGIGGWLA